MKTLFSCFFLIFNNSVYNYNKILTLSFAYRYIFDLNEKKWSMSRKNLYIFLLALACSFQVLAQQSATYTNDLVEYQKALSLYNNQQYLAAQSLFNQIRKGTVMLITFKRSLRSYLVCGLSMEEGSFKRI